MTKPTIESQVRGMVERSARRAGERPRPDRGTATAFRSSAAGSTSPISDVDVTPVGRAGRGRVLVGAAAVLVLVALGGYAVSRSTDPAVETSADAPDRPERSAGGPTTAARRADGIDPMLLDYVAPINGDAWNAARLRFDVGVARAEAATVAECVEAKGFPGAESLRVDEARFFASGIVANLPALNRLAEHGFTNPSLPVTPEYDAAFSCSEEDASAATRWERDAENLRSESFLSEEVPAAIDATESTPVWAEAVSCMTAAGAPPDLLDRVAAREQRMIEDGGEPRSHGFEAFLYEWASDDSGPHPDDPDYAVPEEVRTFVRCTTPFFAEVERALAGPRAAFVDEHRDELLQLQREFEALDVEGD